LSNMLSLKLQFLINMLVLRSLGLALSVAYGGSKSYFCLEEIAKFNSLD
jgi:hypothetical protein